MAPTPYSPLRPLGYQPITATSSTASSLTVPASSATNPLQANYAFIVVETSAIRYRDDGTPPTATVGTPVAAGSSFEYDGELTDLQIIGQAGGGTQHVNYYRAG